MFEKLSDRLEQAMRTLKGQGRITENNVSETMKEIRRALLDADVGFKIAKDFTEEVKAKALGQDVIKHVSPGQLLIKIMNEELTRLMGREASPLVLKPNGTSVVLMSGLQGSGKTTFTGKLALLLKSQGKKVLMVACDVYRPAAVDQLQILGEQIGVPVYADRDQKNPVLIAAQAVKQAKTEGYSVVLVDTAGRLAVDEAMMKEISEIHGNIQPDQTLFVVDAMTGQDAVNTAAAFNQRLNFDGVVLTKMDGDARGGAALTISYTVGKPIKYVSTGEKLQALDVFHPDRMANRILGMGDVVSLVEKAQQQINAEEAARLQKKISKNQFDLQDFYEQIQQIKKMGNMKDLLGMIPGVGKAIKDMDFSDEMFKQTEAIIQSMTPLERREPEILNGSRRERIARGSGTKVQEVNQLLKQFTEMKQMMRKMNGGMPGGAMGQAMNRMRSPFGRS
ncbi:MAG: signal recognition particle protein [Bacteroidota bacterium]|jgi:signal recognition particle subunit SRP54|nr:signal recognition particle protein [Bacteroidota bacterium]MCF8193804.1 signal recognition particle protein [Bacteroidia bacterium]